jgi:hypothetical protein
MHAMPKLRGTPRNRLDAAYTATHESQHVRDLHGRRTVSQRLGSAERTALRKVPRQGGVSDYVTGRAFRRANEYRGAMQRQTGWYEGRADSAATRRTGARADVISGYPRMAGTAPFSDKRSKFGEGYVAGGGTPGATNPLKLMRHRKENARIARARYND